MADIYQRDRERAQSVATLADQLKKNRQQSQGLVRGPGGLLQQLTGAGIQQLAEARGLETPPTTPLGGQAIGATPDQVKMLGDARQKRAALDIGTTGGLAEAQRTKQARTETTATEEETFAKSESLQKLGSVGQKAGQLIDAATSDLTTMAPTAVSLSDKGKELTDDVKTLLIEYVTSGTGPEGLNKIATALGVSPSALDISQYLSADILTGETRDKLAKDLAAIAPDSVTLGQLYPDGVAESLGISETELASLGLDPGSLSGLTVSGLQDFLSQKQTELFAEPQSVRSSLSNPALSTAERDELREQLRGLSSAGVLGVEQAVADLVTQIEAADQITYTDPDTGNLVSRPIGDLLADEGMTGLVTGFLGLTPEKQKELLADAANPLANLYKWISKNRDNLTALTSGAIVSATAEQKKLEPIVKLSKFPGVTPELMTDIFGPGWDRFGSKLTSERRSGNIAALVAIPTINLAQVLTDIKTLSGGNQRIMERLLFSNDSDTLTKLVSSGAYKTFLRDQNIFEQIRKTPPPSPEELGRLLGISNNKINSALSRGILSKEDESLARLILSVYDGKKPASELISLLSLSPDAALRGSSLSDKLQAIITSGSVDPKLTKTADGVYNLTTIKNAGNGPEGIDSILSGFIPDIRVDMVLGNTADAEAKVTAANGILTTLKDLAKRYPSVYADYLKSVEPKIKKAIDDMQMHITGIAKTPDIIKYISGPSINLSPEYASLVDYNGADPRVATRVSLDEFIKDMRHESGSERDKYEAYKQTAVSMASPILKTIQQLETRLTDTNLSAESKKQLESYLDKANYNLRSMRWVLNRTFAGQEVLRQLGM